MKKDIKVGSNVIVKKAWRYDSLAPKEVKGTVYTIWFDGDIGVATKTGGSMKVKRTDIKVIK